MPPPNWAIEPVEVVDYDPRWPQLARHECAQLNRLLAPWLTGAIEHVGSTAIPGLSAKPILDLQASLENLDAASQIATVLAQQDWHYVPPSLDQRPFRRLLVKVADHRRTAHLHLMSADSDRWRQQLAFRDALRDDAELARAYGELKLRLADRHRTDREAYSIGKSRFVTDVLKRHTGREDS
ncbi:MULTISPECIES: GrpB family protein [unclassified Mycolicibacterium]|uniref:GrpB family protein n=1 Tax=unclassified Mycolicibacterium TaxID=2636767 RepID=UPI0012DF7C29|nr:MULTISPECIES: GrpB family protein [unclassified Mycolicibacterium]MUL82184.1 GrpB family protein [Mycolicibacterium sp. CBMA 329]MUL87950.1 GrpB family protein [Mycolicibacterium sp. CBMA 331]MUM02281.1 GrpB family protein [Mycolicibacterium sp. CBMA 334]MUM26435.1 GrpB family protein [Mycolicibacterium sp. CBMA 295]MUM38247.1 GrpB family protein [Mycolicibacterium sp. CBMA 247]